jgi:hypothetical protein
MGQKVQGSSFSSTTRDVPELAALQGLVVASSGVGQAPEFAVLQQQVLTLRSLLLQRSKLEPEKLRSLLRCSNKQAPEPEFLRSLLRCSSKQALELPELGACWPSSRLRSSELAVASSGPIRSSASSGALRGSELAA